MQVMEAKTLALIFLNPDIVTFNSNRTARANRTCKAFDKKRDLFTVSRQLIKNAALPLNVTLSLKKTLAEIKINGMPVNSKFKQEI